MLLSVIYLKVMVGIVDLKFLLKGYHRLCVDVNRVLNRIQRNKEVKRFDWILYNLWRSVFSQANSLG